MQMQPPASLYGLETRQICDDFDSLNQITDEKEELPKPDELADEEF